VIHQRLVETRVAASDLPHAGASSRANLSWKTAAGSAPAAPPSSQLPFNRTRHDAGMGSPRPQSDESMRSVKLRQPRARRAARRHASPFLGGGAVGDEGSHVALGHSGLVVGMARLPNKLLCT